MTSQQQRNTMTWALFPHTLQWRHYGYDSISNHQPHDCLLNHLFIRRSKKISKLRFIGLCEGKPPGTGEFPTQMASHVEHVSIWWRHHAMALFEENPAVNIGSASVVRSFDISMLVIFLRHWINTRFATINACFDLKTTFQGMEFPFYLKIRRSWDNVTFIRRIPTLVKWRHRNC